MDKLTYMANLRALMLSLTENDAATGDLVAIRPGARRHVEIPIRFSGGTIILLFELGSLYLQGFRNSDKSMFVYKGVPYDAAAKTYGFTSDYGELGLDRLLTFQLSMDDLSNALGDLYHAADGTKDSVIKRATWRCAVGLSEALRFQDVAMAVMDGTDIPDLDWSGRTKRGDYKVRVKHR